MGRKTISVVITRPPKGPDETVSEAVRAALGLTLRDHEVQLIFLGPGARTLAGGAEAKGQFAKHLAAFAELGHLVVVEKGRCPGDAPQQGDPAHPAWDRAEIVRLISDSDAVIIV